MIGMPRLLLAAAVLAVALTACGPGNPIPTGSGSSSSTPKPTSTTPSGSPSAGPSGVTAPACARDDLGNSYVDADASAGHLHGVLTVTNTSAATCSLTGYLTVYLGSPEAAVALGAGSTPDAADPGAALDLAPGQSASVRVTIAQAGIVDGCGQAVETSSMIYVLPGEAFEPQVNGQHVTLPTPVQGCTNDQLSLLTVGGFTLG